jgi:hypothetical protein
MTRGREAGGTYLKALNSDTNAYTAWKNYVKDGLSTTGLNITNMGELGNLNIKDGQAFDQSGNNVTQQLLGHIAQSTPGQGVELASLTQTNLSTGETKQVGGYKTPIESLTGYLNPQSVDVSRSNPAGTAVPTV